MAFPDVFQGSSGSKSLMAYEMPQWYLDTLAIFDWIGHGMGFVEVMTAYFIVEEYIA